MEKLSEFKCISFLTNSAGEIMSSTSRLPKLNAGSVHIWTAVIPKGPFTSNDFRFLSNDERLRLKNIHCLESRQQFVHGRIVLRQLIGHYLTIPASDVRFEYSLNGKPLLSSRGNLHFNMSHSGRLIVAALSRQTVVGIDVERVIGMGDLMETACRFFSKRENMCLSQCPDEDGKVELFFRYWTGKEACLKARGRALSDRALRAMDIATASEKPGPCKVGGVNLNWFSPKRGFSAALASFCHLAKVHCFHWN